MKRDIEQEIKDNPDAFDSYDCRLETPEQRAQSDKRVADMMARRAAALGTKPEDKVEGQPAGEADK